MGAIATHLPPAMNLEVRILIHAIAGAIGGLGLHCLVQWFLGAQLTIYGAMAAGFALLVAIALAHQGNREDAVIVGLIAAAFTLGMAIALVSW